MSRHFMAVIVSRAVLSVIVIFSSLMTAGVPRVSAQAAAPELFTDAAPDSTTAPDPAFVIRSKFVEINLAVLLGPDGRSPDASARPEISFNIFPDVTYTGIISQVQKNATQVIWIGTLANTPQGYFYLVLSEGVFIAHIASPQGIYEVSSVGDGVYKLIQIDQASLGEDAPGKPVEGKAVLSQAQLPANGDNGSVIDIMVVYTAAARLAEGSTAAMNARIILAITQTNQAYADAGVLSRLRLVHTEEIAYSETGNPQIDINRLVATSDGYMDGVHALRNTYGADLVALIVENGGTACGMPGAILAIAATAFQVTKRAGCMTGAYTFGHEFAHLQGARHDPFVDPTSTPFAYGHGYIHTGASIVDRWRSVMAYNDGCKALGYNCARLQYFSNPAGIDNSTSMEKVGVNEVDRVLNTTRYTMANFRSTVINTGFYSNFASNATGWVPLSAAWSLSGSNFYSSSGLPNAVSSVVHTGAFGDLTYTVTMKRAGSNSSLANILFLRGISSKSTTKGALKPSYLFEYTNSGLFSVWKLGEAGTFTALKKWTTSAVIIRNGWNTLKVVAVGSSLKFYINGTLVYVGMDDSSRVGQVGMGFYRDAASTGDLLSVDSAVLVNTPTASTALNEEVAQGEEIPGGSHNQAP